MYRVVDICWRVNRKRRQRSYPESVLQNLGLEMSKELREKEKETGERRNYLFHEVYYHTGLRGTAQPSKCDGVVNESAPRLTRRSQRKKKALRVIIALSGGEE